MQPFAKSRTLYYPNSPASLNINIADNLLVCGDVEKQPGPDHDNGNKQTHRTLLCVPNAIKLYAETRNALFAVCAKTFY